jgi:hypothetical protein
MKKIIIGVVIGVAITESVATIMSKAGSSEAGPSDTYAGTTPEWARGLAIDAMWNRYHGGTSMHFAELVRGHDNLTREAWVVTFTPGGSIYADEGARVYVRNGRAELNAEARNLPSVLP